MFKIVKNYSHPYSRALTPRPVIGYPITLPGPAVSKGAAPVCLEL
jgi:hypothetical protein